VNTTSDQVFKIEGALAEFMDFYLDGRKMTLNTNYIVEDGSTKITIKAQTLNDAGAGNHTIAAEFRVGGDEENEMNRAAQNTTVQRGSTGGGTTGGGTPDTTPTTPTSPSPTPARESVTDIFTDVVKGAWYVDDVQWAYDYGYMVGIGNNKFDPSGQQTQATIFSVLARLTDVNLFNYADNTSPEIKTGEWYTNAAQWAKSIGLTVKEFDPDAAVPRADMAVIIVKYLNWLGVDISVDDKAIVIADVDLMTFEQKEAFTILYKIKIFAGTSNTEIRMNPTGLTSRAELSALLHRLDSYIATHKKS
jgi:hypothetical protein